MRLPFTLFLAITTLLTFAQEQKQSAFTFGYSHQLPVGKLAEKFGDNSAIQASFFREKKNNIFYQISGSYLFSNNVNDSLILRNISTSNGNLIGSDGRYANVNLMQRGIEFYLMLGYAFHREPANLTGFYFSTGIGFLQHQIFIDTKNQNIPQLNEEYKKGYDQLTNGISTKFEATYNHYSPNGRFQMYTGIDMTLAYTKHRRPYLFDEMKFASTNMTWDKLMGVKAGIIIPIHRKNEEKFHYY